MFPQFRIFFARKLDWIEKKNHIMPFVDFANLTSDKSFYYFFLISTAYIKLILFILFSMKK